MAYRLKSTVPIANKRAAVDSAETLRCGVFYIANCLLFEPQIQQRMLGIKVSGHILPMHRDSLRRISTVVADLSQKHENLVVNYAAFH